MSKYIPKNPPPESINNSEETPLFNFFSLLVSVSGLLVFAYLLLYLVSLTFPLFISMENEQKIFKKNYFFLNAKDSSLPDEIFKINKLTNDLWLGATKNNHIQLKVRIFKYSHENALITPGAHIFISDKLLENIKSENELSFVICHELAHFYHRDTIKGLGKMLTSGLFTAVLSGASGGSNLPLLAETLINSKFSRDQETNADLFALSCLNNKYGHVKGYADFFERIKVYDIKAFKYSSTHPLSSERIENLKKIIQSKAFNSDGALEAFNKNKNLLTY